MASEQAMALYRKLNSSGTAITTNNWREWDRLASSAMKMPDFTPPGQSESLHELANEVGIEIQALKSRASRPGSPDTFAVEDRFYFGKGRKERFASISMPRQSVTSGASGTWKKREVTVRGKKAWLVELYRGSVLVGYLNQHPDTRQFHAFDGNTDRQIGVGSESEMKRLVESL